MTLADALRTVAAALDALADALASGRPDRVLAAELPLARAVGALTAARLQPGDDRREVRDERLAVRLALARCEHLGRASAALERLFRPQPPYGPASHRPAPVVSSMRAARS